MGDESERELCVCKHSRESQLFGDLEFVLCSVRVADCKAAGLLPTVAALVPTETEPIIVRAELLADPENHNIFEVFSFGIWSSAQKIS